MIGTTISHYRILDKLGEGGMGVVYKAHDTKLDRTVALKFLPQHLTKSEEDKQRFIREAKSAAALNHPHICTIYSVEEHEGTQFISMEYIDGTTLRDKMTSSPLTNGGLKVMDFGLAKIKGSMNLTKTGSTVGTILYMSPEQIRGEQPDHRTDVWSLGVMLYEMITGNLPFNGEYEHAVSYKILNEDPDMHDDVPSQFGDSYRPVILKCLDKNPDRRFQSMVELISGLQDIKSPVAAGGKPAQEPDETTQRIAVLPIVNMSRDKEDEYFSDGMTEELITMLSKISGLRVIARTTSMQYKSTVTGIGEIGRQLNVSSLLEGSVRKSNEQVRISIQLIDTKTEETLWSESYDRMLRDVFGIQRDIAHQVTEELKIKLLPGEQTQIDKQLTRNMDSYTLYLKGKYHWNKFTYEGVQKSIEYFTEAITLDPEYALGYSGLANSYSVLGLDFEHPRVTFGNARQAARKAIELDPSLPEAHASVAAVLFFFEHEYAGAETALRRAIQLNQSYAEAHELYAYLLSAMGRHDEAYKEIQYAINLDPLSLIINKDLGSYYYWARQYEKSIGQFQKTLEMEPRFFITYGELGWAYSGIGLYKEALDAFSKAVEISGGARSFDIAGVGYMYAKLGEREKAQEVLDDLIRKSSQRFIGPEDIALVYAALGDRDTAFSYLEKALREHGFYMCFLSVDHRFDILRDDPRFSEIVNKMGL